MGKALGFIAGAALITASFFVGGPAWLAPALLGMGGSMAVNSVLVALAPKPKVKREWQVGYSDSASPATIVYGQCFTGGMQVIPPINTGASGEYQHLVLALADHECDSMTSITADKLLIPGAFCGAVTGTNNDGLVNGGEYINRAWIRFYSGSSTQTADYILRNAYVPAFTTAFRGRGRCYVAIRLKWDKDYFGGIGIPNFAVLLKGKKCYDPRLDSSPGANPTSASYIAWTQNPALHIADYLMDATLGMEQAATDIDWDLVVAAANVCDTTVSIPGGSEKRYRCNVVLNANADFEDNLATLALTMLGRVYPMDGKWRIYAGAWTSATDSIAEADWIGPIALTCEPGREKRFNEMRAFFMDADRNYERNEAYIRTNATYRTSDGSERISKEIELLGVQNKYQAQRIAEFLLRQSRNGKVLRGRLGPKWLGLKLYDTVAVNHARLGFANKGFRVTSIAQAAEGYVDVTLLEEQSTDWTDLTSGEYNQPSTSSIPTQNPTIPDSSSGLTATPEAGAIRLSWTAPAIRPAETYYKIKEATVNNWNSATTVWTGLATVARILKTNQNTYYYWVEAWGMTDYSLHPSMFAGVPGYAGQVPTQEIEPGAVTGYYVNTRASFFVSNVT